MNRSISTILLIVLLLAFTSPAEAGLFGKKRNGNKIEKGVDPDCSCQFEKTYHENGNLRSQIFFKNGFRTGIWEYYNPDGTMFLQITNLEESIPANDDTRHGLYQYYWKDMLTYSENWQNNNKVKQLVVIPPFYKEMKEHYQKSGNPAPNYSTVQSNTVAEQ